MSNLNAHNRPKKFRKFESDLVDISIGMGDYYSNARSPRNKEVLRKAQDLIWDAIDTLKGVRR